VFRDFGLSPEFIPTHDRRSGELRLRISARRSVEVELKSPQTLQRRPGEAVESRAAAGTIEKTLKDARGQLRSASGGVLVIGGAFWNADMDEHAQAAAALLQRKGSSPVIGVLLAATTVELQRTRGTGGFDDTR